VTDDDRVFKALADGTRRFLLDLLFVRDGRTLKDLEVEVGDEMTRFGVMKHLKVLEEAGLVVARKVGREKLHHLNPVPIRLIHDRWIDKYAERRVAALTDLKQTLEGAPHERERDAADDDADLRNLHQGPGAKDLGRHH
jgi:DNA-binding transcriptional ArsR family regulator